jgi:hypothetical protein
MASLSELGRLSGKTPASAGDGLSTAQTQSGWSEDSPGIGTAGPRAGQGTQKGKAPCCRPPIVYRGGNMSIQFRTRNGEPTAIGSVLLAWWQGLDDDRAGRAILRRASSPTLVAFTAPYQRLYRRLQAAGWPMPMRGHRTTTGWRPLSVCWLMSRKTSPVLFLPP